MVEIATFGLRGCYAEFGRLPYNQRLRLRCSASISLCVASRVVTFPKSLGK